MQQNKVSLLYSKVFNRNSLHILDAFLFMDFQDVAHASELHNSTSTTDTASNPQSFEKKAIIQHMKTYKMQLHHLNLFP